MNVLDVVDLASPGQRERVAGAVEQAAGRVDPEALELETANFLSGRRVYQRVISQDVVALAGCQAGAPGQ